MQLIGVVDAARESANISTTRLAARADLSRATLHRLLAGASARVDDLQEIALAAGLAIDVTLVPLSDPIAAVAGRILLGDDSLGAWTAEALLWVDRLERYVASDPSVSHDIAATDEAGRAANPAARQGSMHLRGDHRDIDRLVSAGRASGNAWALSGWAALDGLEVDVDAPTVMWVDDVRRVTQLLHGSFAPARNGEADLIVAPAHPSVFAGVAEIEDVLLVDPLQAYIDAAGLGGDARVAALAHLGGAR
jgi:transcriptional regulator with XRE-family HTH domain